MILGICGFISSGKDTIADYLVTFEEFRRESFAGALKDAVSQIFGWDRTLLEGKTKQAREWREQVDPWWSQRLSMPSLTPRWVLQYWGTEVARGAFHNDIWIASLENKLRTSTDNIVISDCRFPNEIASIKNSGGKILWVKRGEIPEWFDVAVMANTGNRQAQEDLKKYQVHSSETAWIGTEFDYIVDNNGSVDELFLKIHKIVHEIN